MTLITPSGRCAQGCSRSACPPHLPTTPHTSTHQPGGVVTITRTSHHLGAHHHTPTQLLLLLQLLVAALSTPPLGGSCAHVWMDQAGSQVFSSHPGVCVQAMARCATLPPWMPLQTVAITSQGLRDQTPRQHALRRRRGQPPCHSGQPHLIRHFPTPPHTPHARGCCRPAHLDLIHGNGRAAWRGVITRMQLWWILVRTSAHRVAHGPCRRHVRAALAAASSHPQASPPPA